MELVYNSLVIDYFGFSYSLLGLSISLFFFLHVHQFSLRPREEQSFTTETTNLINRCLEFELAYFQTCISIGGTCIILLLFNRVWTPPKSDGRNIFGRRQPQERNLPCVSDDCETKN
ncbi:hypothetical protein H5410_006192 [Solanum commersonii]|uniref:Uncharacterized protein n=1 Tax=Solanum commersonii TaxID=4109 RepID=A0A9J6A8I0_SOLCO|nr:hypothetical protein H5410_006192 [Solanum commersonii]